MWGNPEGTLRITKGPVTTDPKGEVRFELKRTTCWPSPRILRKWEPMELFLP